MCEIDAAILTREIEDDVFFVQMMDRQWPNNSGHCE